MIQAEPKPDENSSATQAEIERLKQALSREHDRHLQALADFDNIGSACSANGTGTHRQANAR